MKHTGSLWSYLSALFLFLSVILVSVISLRNINTVYALGFAGEVPEGEYAMGTAVDLRPDDDLLDSMLIDMYGRFQLFPDLADRQEPFSYIITITVDSDGNPIYYRFLFAEELGNAGSPVYQPRNYGYRVNLTNNNDFIEQYGITGLVYGPEGDLVIIEDGIISGSRVWYTSANQSNPLYGAYNRSDWDPDYGLSGTYMLYTNAPGYDSSFILPAFSLGEFPDSDGGDEGFWDSIIGFFVDIWNWLVNFWDNLTAWFVNILSILWDWLLDFIKFVLGLFVPTDLESWSNLIEDIRVGLLSAFGFLYYAIETMVGILIRISTAPAISSITIPGEVFGSSLTLDFGQMAEKAPAAWNTAVLLIRGVFVINVWPPVIDFYHQFIFRDYFSASTKRDLTRGDD